MKTFSFPRFFVAIVFAGIGLIPVDRAASDEPRETEEGYLIPQPDFDRASPAIHGSHPGYRIEWWYLTGHLFSRESEPRRFGVQATFFRLAQEPGGSEPSAAVPAFGSRDFFLAHMALADESGERFLHEERLNREGWDAGAKVGDLDLYNGNWSLKRESGLETLESRSGAMRLVGSILSEARFDLRLVPAKPAVLFGDDGLSKKGEEASAVSLYVTFPRLMAEGSLVLGEDSIEVEGELWMDHEISSSQLGRDQVGWDWTSIQFFDGREMMAYILRKPDGAPDTFSALTWIDEEGNLTRLDHDTFEWQTKEKWESAKTGDAYPIRPRIVARDPSNGETLRLRLEPILDPQEITGGLGGVSYWEGACDVIDEDRGEVVGRAYLELTGYAEGDDLQRRLQGN